nr:hypothetical protein [Tanacetum cinerariifolium]
IADMGNIRRLLRIRANTVGVQEGLCPLHAVPGNGFFFLAIARQHVYAVLVDLADDGRLKTADRTLLGQFLCPAIAGQAREAAFRAAIAMALVVFDQAILHGFVGARNHRHLRNAQVADGFTVINLCCGLDTISPVAQVDLVDVELENLVF